MSDVRYSFEYLIYFQLGISIYCLILGIFRNSGYRSILAGELAIREEPSHEVIDPPIFAPAPQILPAGSLIAASLIDPNIVGTWLPLIDRALKFLKN